MHAILIPPLFDKNDVDDGARAYWMQIREERKSAAR